MVDAVFAANRSGSNAVFDYEYLLPGTIYTKNLTPIVETPVLEVSVHKATAINIGRTVFPELRVTKSLAKTVSFTVTPTLEIWSATTLLGIGEFVVSPTMSLALRDGTTLELTQTPVLTVETEFISGSAHSTFPKAFNFTLTPELTVGRGSQTYLEFTQAPVLEVVFDADIAGAHTYGLPSFDLVQFPILDVTSETIILPPVASPGGAPGVGWHGGRHHGADWMLEPIAPERRREPTNAELRKAARDAEQVARRRAAAEQRLREEALIKTAEAEVERVRGMLSQMDVLDAATRPQYEQQIQGLMQQQQAAMAEIQRLRSELQQQQQVQVQQQNEQNAVMLLLAE